MTSRSNSSTPSGRTPTPGSCGCCSRAPARGARRALDDLRRSADQRSALPMRYWRTYSAAFWSPIDVANRDSSWSMRLCTSASVSPTMVLKSLLRTIASKSVPTVSQCPRRISLFCGEHLGAAVEVRVPRVLRRDLERHLLAAAGDPHRDAALLQRERPHDRAVHLVVLAVERRACRSSTPGA